MVGGDVRSNTLAFTNQPAALANLFVIYESTPTFQAAETIFYFCVNTYNVSVAQGVTTTNIVASSTTLSNTTTTNLLHLQDPLSTTNQTIPVNLTAATS